METNKIAIFKNRCQQFALVSLYVFVFGISWSSVLMRIGMYTFLLSFILSAHWGKILKLVKQPVVFWSLCLAGIAVASMVHSIASTDLAYIDAMRYLKLLAVVPMLYVLNNSQKQRSALFFFAAGVSVLMLPTLLDGLGVAKAWNIPLSDFRNQAYTTSTLEKGSLNLVYWRNQLVHGLFVGGLCLICLCTALKSSRYRYPCIFVSLLCVIDIVYFIHGRMAMLGLICTLAAFIIFNIKTWLHRIFAGIIVVILIVTTIVLVPTVNKRFNSALQEINSYSQTENINSSIGHRFHYWKLSLEIFKEYPLLGGGSGAFRHSLVSNNDPFAAEGHSHAHNEYITLISQYGLLGAFCLMALIIALIYRLKRLKDPLIKCTTGLLLLLFAINCLTDSMVYNEIEGWMFVLLISLVGGAHLSVTQSPDCNKYA